MISYDELLLIFNIILLISSGNGDVKINCSLVNGCTNDNVLECNACLGNCLI